MRFLRSVVVVLLCGVSMAAAYPELGLELPDEAAQTPAALGELVRNEIDRWVPMIKKAGVVVQ